MPHAKKYLKQTCRQRAKGESHLIGSGNTYKGKNKNHLQEIRYCVSENRYLITSKVGRDQSTLWVFDYLQWEINDSRKLSKHINRIFTLIGFNHKGYFNPETTRGHEDRRRDGVKFMHAWQNWEALRNMKALYTKADKKNLNWKWYCVYHNSSKYF